MSEIVNVNFKVLDDRVQHIPFYNQADNGIDLAAIEFRHINDEVVEYDTGIAVEVPEGYMGLLIARSSVSKKGLYLCNGAGVIDPSYRGPLKFRFYCRGTYKLYIPGERIGQLIIVPQPHVNLLKVDALSDTSRGIGGFGSTGN